MLMSCTAGRGVFVDTLAFELVEEVVNLCISTDDVVAALTRITAQATADIHRRYVPPNMEFDGLYA